MRRLYKMDNLHKGRRGFVIGGGPSIRDIPKEILNVLEQEEITVGANHAFKLFEPTYLVFIDRGYWYNFGKEIRALRKTGHIFYPSKLTDIAGQRGGPKFCQFPHGNEKSHPIAPRSFRARIPTYNNSGVTALRMAYILGLNPIYLLGCDLNKDAKMAGDTHFHDCYDAKRKNATKAQRYDAFRESFVKTIEVMRSRVVSCSPVSSLNDAIPYRPIEEVVEIVRQDKKNVA